MYNDNSDRPVCVFDSGIGGLNLLKRCCEVLPCTNFVYFADNYNVPYGNLPKEEILRLTLKTFDEIEKLNPQAAVVACNTVTAECIDVLRGKYSFPIVGIQPAIKQAQRVGGKCLVLATNATVRSKSFCNLINANNLCNVVVYPCTGLAEYIEENIFNLPEKLPQGYLPDVSVSSVVLGCTHYIFIEEIIKKYYSCEVFDGIVGTADHLANILGIGDHSFKNYQKITFKNGNCTKNRDIFRHLVVKGDKSR